MRQANSFSPLLRWAGSKKRQYTAISRHFPRDFARYSEPFAGSAAFAFCMGTRGASLNDLNSDVIDFYRHCREDPVSFHSLLVAMPRNSTAYYDFRRAYNLSPRSLQRSVLFYYLNRNCFNGIYRLNKAGDFNVPFSDSRVSPYLELQEFVSSAKLLAQATLCNTDFEVFCLEQMDAGDFTFIDPPYYAAKRMFSEYTVPPFNESDFERLLRVLVDLDRKGVKFLLSYPDGFLAEKAAERWRSVKTPVLRTIASDPNKRHRVQEVLIYNYDSQST